VGSKLFLLSTFRYSSALSVDVAMENAAEKYPEKDSFLRMCSYYICRDLLHLGRFGQFRGLMVVSRDHDTDTETHSTLFHLEQ